MMVGPKDFSSSVVVTRHSWLQKPRLSLSLSSQVSSMLSDHHKLISNLHSHSHLLQKSVAKYHWPSSILPIPEQAWGGTTPDFLHYSQGPASLDDSIQSMGSVHTSIPSIHVDPLDRLVTKSVGSSLGSCFAQNTSFGHNRDVWGAFASFAQLVRHFCPQRQQA